MIDSRSWSSWRLAVLVAGAALVGAVLMSAPASAATASVTIDSLEVGVGAVGKVTLRADDVPEPGLGAWTVDVQYDPALVSVVGCAAGRGGVCNSAYRDNAVRVVGTSLLGLPGDSALASIAFGCAHDGTSPLTLSISVLVDSTPGDPQPIDAAVVHGGVVCVAGPEPPPGPAEPPPDQKLPGDSNCDGVVDAVDAALVLQLAAGLTGSVPCPDNADANHDGAVDAVDAAIILQIAAGLL